MLRESAEMRCVPVFVTVVALEIVFAVAARKTKNRNDINKTRESINCGCEHETLTLDNCRCNADDTAVC